MARYINASELIRRIKIETNLGGTLESYNRYPLLNLIDNIPPADVAPKSEIAREIFEEIKRKVASKIPMKFTPIFKRDLGYDAGVIDGKHDAFYEVLVLIAELKKKHAEGGYE